MHGITVFASLPGNPDTPSMAVSACEKNVIPRTYMDQIENGDSMPAKIVDKFFQHDSIRFYGDGLRAVPDQNLGGFLCRFLGALTRFALFLGGFGLGFLLRFGHGNTLVETVVAFRVFLVELRFHNLVFLFVVQGCKFHQQLLPRFVETDVGCKAFYQEIAGDEIALFVGQRIDDSDFLFGCQIIRFGESHGGEVFAPQASEHDVIENVVFQLGKRRRGDLLVADDLPDGFDGFFVCEFRVADFLLLKEGDQFPG